MRPQYSQLPSRFTIVWLQYSRNCSYKLHREGGAGDLKRQTLGSLVKFLNDVQARDDCHELVQHLEAGFKDLKFNFFMFSSSRNNV